MIALALAMLSTAPLAETGYDPDRGAYVRSADGAWELNPYGMVQLTHDSVFQGGETRETGFKLHSAKLIFHGHILDRDLTYHFQVNGGEGQMVAEDMFLRWDPSPWFGVLVGQNEVPFNRQHITLEAYQELVRRSVVDSRFNLQRDIGAAVYLSAWDHRLEGTFGVFNGARQNAPNDDTTYMTTARVAFQPFGPIAFREADLDDSPRPRLSIAAAIAHNPQRVVSSTRTLHEITQGVLETTFRYRGLSLTTETHLRRQRENQQSTAVDHGVFVQAGYFVIPRRLEIVGRHGLVAGAVASTDVVREDTLGVSAYMRGHRFKLQAEASRLGTRDGGERYEVHLQLQMFL